jgi:hypothetical protein
MIMVFVSKFFASGKADSKGKFSVNLSNLQPGDRISAIATLSQYGTSEPGRCLAIIGCLTFCSLNLLPLPFLGNIDTANA